MTPFTIRQITTESEWDEALSLLISVYVGGGFVDPARAADLFSRHEIDGEALALIAITPASRVCGVVFMLHPGGRLRQIAENGEDEFRLLGVDPECRRAGIGEALVRECLRIATARSSSRMVLSTQETMRDDHRLYERLGFSRQPDRDWQSRKSRRSMLVYSLDISH
jgi:ribosomal protein S18 acetylase RimI-like enzyme